MAEQPSIGRIVHYVPHTNRPLDAAHHAAIVTEVSNVGAKRSGTGKVETLVTLRVFGPATEYVMTAVHYSVVPAPGTWHFPERV